MRYLIVTALLLVTSLCGCRSTITVPQGTALRATAPSAPKELYQITWNELDTRVYGPSIPVGQIPAAFGSVLWTHGSLPEPASLTQVQQYVILARDGGTLPVNVVARKWDFFPQGKVSPGTFLMLDDEHVADDLPVNERGPVVAQYSVQLARWAQAGRYTPFIVYGSQVIHVPGGSIGWGIGNDANTVNGYLDALDECAPMAKAAPKATYLEAYVVGGGYSIDQQIAVWNMSIYGIKARNPQMKIYALAWGAKHSTYNPAHSMLSDQDFDKYIKWLNTARIDGIIVWGARQDNKRLMDALAPPPLPAAMRRAA